MEIDKIGMIKRQVNPGIFSALISSIISQQISTKAATTVNNRLIDLVGEIIPEDINLSVHPPKGQVRISVPKKV